MAMYHRRACLVAIPFILSMLLVGCLTIRKSVSAKSNETVYRLEGLERDRSVLESDVERIASEVGFQHDPRLAMLTTIVKGYSWTASVSELPYKLYLQIKKPSWSFTTNDIMNSDLLFHRLRNPSSLDTIAQFVASNLSGTTRQMLSDYSIRSSAELSKYLASDLNGIINRASAPEGEPIYDDHRFGSVTLSAETIALLKLTPIGFDLKRLNRKLLEDAFPTAISKEASRDYVFEVHLSHVRNLTTAKTENYVKAEKRLTSQLQEAFGNRIQISTNVQWIP